MENMTYMYKSNEMHDIYLISMKYIIHVYGSKYEVILKMLLLYLVEKAWRFRDIPSGFLFRNRG